MTSQNWHIKEWLKGPLITVLAMVIYAVTLGLFIALMLLVIAMEEGGDSLTSEAVPLAEAVVLLSQGAGFEAGVIRLTLVPLLLTMLLIGVIRSLSIRFTASWRTYITGLASWIGFNILIMQGVTYTFVDPVWLIAIKCGTVFTLGFLLAMPVYSPLIPHIITAYRERISIHIRQALRVGVVLGAAVMSFYLICGIITVGVWTLLNWRTMAEVFELSGMQIGSRILTTISCIAWLPNMCIWAVSWLFGGGFSIGELADFTLWIGQASDLPAVPIFGLFPEPVNSDTIRIIFMTIPLAVGLISGLLALLLNQGFCVRVGKKDDPSDWRRLIELFAYPAAAFCLGAALISLVMTAVFALSNGSLGYERLAHIGVNVMSSTQTVARPAALGLLTAWLLMLIGVSTVFGIRWIMKRRRLAHTSSAADSPTGTPAPDGTSSTDKTSESDSSHALSFDGTLSEHETSAEQLTDDNKPTDVPNEPHTLRVVNSNDAQTDNDRPHKQHTPRVVNSQTTTKEE